MCVERATTAPLKILVLTPQFPYPPHQGTTIRNYNLVAALAERHQVHLLSFGDPGQSQGTPLDDLCTSVQVIHPPQRTTRQRFLGLILSRLPDMAHRLPSPDFQAALSSTLERTQPDVVEVEGIELAGYLFQAAAERGAAKRPLLVFDDHNAEYVLQQRAFETDARLLLAVRQAGSLHGLARRWIGAAYSWVQWQRLRGYERRACRAADRVVAVSDADARALRRLDPGIEPVVVPNGVDVAHYTATDLDFGLLKGRAPEAGPADLVFTGKMDFRPNVDAVLWFAQQVLPLVLREMPESHFWVVGKDPHPRLEPLLQDPHVTVTGQVSDVRPYLVGATAYLIPLRIGGGTRLKVLEAMASGRAIVSTTVGCEGFDLRSGQELLIADTPEAFATAVVTLLHDGDLRAGLGRQARRFADGYDWSRIVPRLERVYQ